MLINTKKLFILIEVFFTTVCFTYENNGQDVNIKFSVWQNTLACMFIYFGVGILSHRQGVWKIGHRFCTNVYGGRSPSYTTHNLQFFRRRTSRLLVCWQRSLQVRKETSAAIQHFYCGACLTLRGQWSSEIRSMRVYKPLATGYEEARPQSRSGAFAIGTFAVHANDGSGRNLSGALSARF